MSGNDQRILGGGPVVRCGYKMSKPCERCKKDGYYYCNHTDKQDTHFFKVMIGDFRERMTIPDKFLRHFRGKLARNIKLESRNGCTFDVQVTKNLDKLVLQSGWKAFVSAHDLKMGDFLLFKYNGTSQLKVLIFDPSGCEKVTSCLVMKNGTHGQEPIDISSSCHDTPMKLPTSERKAWKQRDNSNQGNKIVYISSSSSPFDSSDCVSSSEDDLEAHFVPSYIFPRGTRLTGAEKKKLKEKVQAIHSETPIYGYVMNKSSICGNPCTVELCRKYADLYLPFEDQTLTLQRHGKSWEVRCRIKEDKCKRLLKGWRRFAHDNNLHLGDICLFELLKKKKNAMNVHIIGKK